MYVKVYEVQLTRVRGGRSRDSLKVASSDCQSDGNSNSADLAVLWLRAWQLCYLGGHTFRVKDGKSADLADSLKAGKEDGQTDNAPLKWTA